MDILTMKPVLASIVATAGVALVKVPPVVVLEKVVVVPTTILSVPFKGATVIGSSSLLLHDVINKPKDIAKAKNFVFIGKVLFFII